MSSPVLVDLPRITTTMARELAVAEHVCIRPVIRPVLDRDTNSDTTVAIACGSTRETQCPPCSEKARVLRMQQCAEGWHRDHEPEPPGPRDENEDQVDVDRRDESSDDDRRVRSTRRRQDAPDLPRVPLEDRTVGQTFTAPDGTTYRPSMFLTLTSPSYGPIIPGTGTPTAPGSYDYRRAALDALHFPKLVDRFWQNLRRSAGYRVQYFAAVEPQKRLAPHLHAAIRGAIPRATLREVVKATYVQVWWPAFDEPVYLDPDRFPVWHGQNYVDPQTGEVLPTWDQALDQLDADPDARPVHVMRFAPRPTCGASSPPHPTPTEPSATSSNTSPNPSPTPTPTPRRRIPALRRTLTGFTGSCGSYPARPAVRTGSATASNPPPLVPVCVRAGAARKPMIGRTSASAAAASWSRANGPAKP